jgi:aminomethyltransferase
MLKKPPLFHLHKKLGAKMTIFSGWVLPLQYTSIIEEHTTTRTTAGLFDISHMGRIIVSGERVVEFLQKIVTNDVSTLYVGKAMYTCMCYENGTTVDDLIVFKLEENKFMLVVNAINTKKDFEWLNKNNEEKVKIEDITDFTAKLDLQGPKSEEILQKITSTDISQIKRFHFLNINVDNAGVLASRTGYTGEDGFELFFDVKFVEQLWNKILHMGKEYGIKPVGLGARDTLRIEACYSLYGHELSESITPVEASLGWLVKENKGWFIGKEILSKQKKEGTKRKLVAFEMLEKAVPRSGYEIWKEERKIGFVTSGTFSPTFKKGIGLGLVESEYANVGEKIKVIVRGEKKNGLIVPKPFYPYRGGK